MVLARMRPWRWPSLRSSWWLPEPLPITSTPSSACGTDGLDGVHSSSHVSHPTEMPSRERSATKPNGTEGEAPLYVPSVHRSRNACGSR
jgi:hypothetical protein